jgi:predicted GH43/DUF377 family glycosyl hydrolase
MTTAKAAATLCIFISASGCGRYADFTLPPLAPAKALSVQPVFTEHAVPVLERETATDVLNPSVAFHDSQFFNFYSEYDGHTWHSALATSSNGFVWQKRGRFLSPDPKTWEASYIAANGSAANLNGLWTYWYVAGDRDRPSIGFVRSNDLKLWKKHPKPVLDPGPRGSFDEFGVADPYVIQINNWLYMYYLGQNRARQQQIGLARSSATGPNSGFVWEKLRSNPVLEISAPGSGAPGSGTMDENGLGEPAVWQANGWYWMLFTGRDIHENRTLRFARSSDGVHWVRFAAIPRQYNWDAKVMCDPTVLVRDETQNMHNPAQKHATLVWFGGGDSARPDENIHGQIGIGEITWVPQL